MQNGDGANLPTIDTSPIPDDVRSLFGRPPVLKSESKARYEVLFEKMAAAIRPEDVFEWMMVKTIVDLIWEIERYRRTKTIIIDNAHKEGLANLVRPLIRESSIQHSRERDALELAEGYFVDPKFELKVGEILSLHNLDATSIAAEAVRHRLPELEKIERMVASKEARRADAYRDLDIYRESRRYRAEIETKPVPKQLPFIATKQEPAGTGQSEGAEGGVQEPA